MKSLATILLVLLSFSVNAENWPQWRGPVFNGSTTQTGLPATWSKTENVAWVAPMPGPSAATPAIWDDRVFVSSVDTKTKDLLALCLNRKDGKVLWQKVVAPSADRRPMNSRNNNMASPSPITDGKNVWFFYGTGHLAAFDIDGKELWSRDLQKDFNKFAIMWGYGASGLLYKDKLYIPLLQKDKNTYVPGSDLSKKLDSFILAVDPKTGKDLWKQVRPTDAKEETQEAYTTPIPCEFNGKSEILIYGADYTTAHDPETGKELWRCGGINPVHRGDVRVVPSPVCCDGLVFMAPPKHWQAFTAIKDGGSGDVTATNVAWTLPKEMSPDVCTPLVYKNMLYVLNGDAGRSMLYCIDPKTGAKKWEGQIPGKTTYWCSPTCADGRIYSINEAGEVAVCEAGDAFKILMTVPLGEGACFSSIAIAQGQLFIRTGQNVYCIGK
ncbi:MAG TPA: PQQ-binding-like beta-propeller repeat protein [Planctomycetota bacterium]|jgi:outer membrane protein assembly factor BamB